VVLGRGCRALNHPLVPSLRRREMSVGLGRAACIAPREEGERGLLLRGEKLMGREMEGKIKLYLRGGNRGRRTKGEEIKRKN